MVTMRQKSSLPQTLTSVSKALTPDSCETTNAMPANEHLRADDLDDLEDRWETSGIAG
jgi:hypothetical protein